MENDLVAVPPHVRPEQVFDFDIYFDQELVQDAHSGYKRLHKLAPDIFFTPRNGGHWIVTRYEDQVQILRDVEHFSNRELDIPKSNSPYVMIPLNLDPPEHTRYRAVLMRYFGAAPVRDMEPRLRQWANRLIDRVFDEGRCDFLERLGAPFPVSVFMELMGMPLERFDEFRAIVLEYFSKTTVERRLELQETFMAIMMEIFEDRRRAPRDDMATGLVTAEVRGQKLTDEELRSMGFLLFIAGLDTVANALTFAFRHLAMDAPLQRRLAAEPHRIPDFVEESLRRYAVVNQTRIVKKDTVIKGAHFREGDMVCCPLTLAGLDDRVNPEPEKFDIDRPERKHITFSYGPHVCIGNILARAEMRVFTEEWLKRVDSFRIVPGTKLEWRGGGVMSLAELPVEWTPRKSAA